MTKWMSRFAVLAVVGTLLASALVVGCGGSPDEEPAATGGAGNGAGAGAGNATNAPNAK